MRHTQPPVIIPVLFAVFVTAHADTLVLRSGQEIAGTLLGATARQLEFLPSSGKSMKVGLDKVETVNFSEPPVVAPPSPRPATPALRKPVLIPTGTTIRVRTADSIDVDYTQAGAKF